MAQKKFKQFFAKDFGGIDAESSALEDDAGKVNRAVNYEFAVSNSLRGRVGCQIAANPAGFTALFPYNYTRTQDQYDITYTAPAGVYPNQTPSLTTTKTTADGASISKIIGLNQQMFVLDNISIVVTYVSGTYPFTWYSYVNGTNINFVIKANGVSILDTSLGGGITSFTNIWSLLNTIDGLAQLSVSRTTRGTCPPFAIVNGNQTTAAGATTTYGTRFTVTVLNTPHNFLPGDIIYFPTSSTSGVNLKAGLVISVTATTIVYVGPQVTLLNGDILGILGQSAAGFNISTAQTASSGNLTLTFPYWRLIPEGDYSFGQVFNDAFTLWGTKTATSFYAPQVSTNAQGNCYIASSVVSSTLGYSNHLVKTDNQQIFRAGLPAPSVTATATAGGALTGVYRYKCFLRRRDAQGNIIDGPLSSVNSVTYAAQFGTIATTFTTNYANFTGWGERSAYKYTAEAPAAGQSFYVDDNTGAPGLNAFLQPGDMICLLDNVGQTYTAAANGVFLDVGLATVLGTQHVTRCTSYDGNSVPSSIKVADSSGYTIPNNTEISTGLSMVILRTAVGGNTYYYLCEFPITSYTGTFTVYDNANDALLTSKAQFEEPVLGKEHDAPPACSLVCQHQGGLVVARGFAAPNTVAFSSADNIEYFPTASNSFDVPSTQSGYITAIASDTNDRLAVFKERAYYDIVGDLDGGNFSVNVKNEGDYGITSQASLVRIQDSLVGLSKNGFIVVSDGILSGGLYNELNARLINQTFSFNWAVACNDAFNRRYICSIPNGTIPQTFVIDYSRQKIHTFERSYTLAIDPAGGMAPSADNFYHLSNQSPYGVYRRLYRFNGDSPSGNGNGDSFLDNTNTISYIFESNVINNNEPDVLNTPIRLRIWSIPNDYVVDGWVPFTINFDGIGNPAASYFSPTASAYSGGTTSAVSFAASTDIFKDIKLVQSKTHFYIFRFVTFAARTAPFITGIELLYAENYSQEDLIK